MLLSLIPREQEQIEERLFALRDAARKHRCQIIQLPTVAARLKEDLTNLEDGAGHLDALQKAAKETRSAYFAKAEELSARAAQDRGRARSACDGRTAAAEAGSAPALRRMLNPATPSQALPVSTGLSSRLRQIPAPRPAPS